jgi:hypothetical protein
VKRKILFLILFPVWLFQCFILPFALRQEQENQYKLFSEISEFAKLKQAQMILFGSGEEIQWVRKNKEFLYQGRLYDVIRIDPSENVIRVLCVRDSREDNLKAQQADLYNGGVKDGSKKTDLFKFFNLSQILRMNTCEQKEVLPPQPILPLPLIYSKVFGPPPDNFSFF